MLVNLLFDEKCMNEVMDGGVTYVLLFCGFKTHDPEAFSARVCLCVFFYLSWLLVVEVLIYDSVFFSSFFVWYEPMTVRV